MTTGEGEEKSYLAFHGNRASRAPSSKNEFTLSKNTRFTVFETRSTSKARSGNKQSLNQPKGRGRRENTKQRGGGNKRRRGHRRRKKEAEALLYELRRKTRFRGESSEKWPGERKKRTSKPCFPRNAIS